MVDATDHNITKVSNVIKISMSKATQFPNAVQLMADHILTHMPLDKAASSHPSRPLFVAVQGPQGIGKTYLTSLLRESLASPPHSLNVAMLSIDDFYLSHRDLRALAEAHPGNRLLLGRGLPGTHDMKLGRRVLKELREINVGSAKVVTTPVFDKSLHGGEGDQLPYSEGVVVCGPVDVVILEGWFVGFCPIPEGDVEMRWELWPDGLCTFDKKEFRLEDLKLVNELLRNYVDWWALFDVFVQVSESFALRISTRVFDGSCNCLQTPPIIASINGGLSKNII